MRALKPQGEGYEALDDCNTIGILVGILGLGIQQGYDPADPPKDEYLLTFETPNELGTDGRPYHITKQVTISTHEKASLRIMLEAVHGKALPNEKVTFTGDDANDEKVCAFVEKITSGAIGKACLINIAKYKKQNGYDGNKITGFTKLPKGMAFDKPKTVYGFFDLEKPDWELFKKFPEWQRNVVNKESYASELDPDQDAIPMDDFDEMDEADWG